MADMPTTKTLCKFMKDRVYTKKPMIMKANIHDEKEFTRVVFQGLDMIVHVITLWHDTDHKNAKATYKFPMLYDERVMMIRTFNAKKEDDFIEAVQDAAIAGTSAGSCPTLHDDEGFLMLRPRQLEVVNDRRWRETTNAISYMQRMINTRKNKDPQLPGDIIPAGGWDISIQKRSIHYELVDTLAMLFSVTETNSTTDRYPSYGYRGPLDNNDIFEMVNELLAVFASTNSGMTPVTVNHVLDMLKNDTITAEMSARSRKDRGRYYDFDPYD